MAFGLLNQNNKKRNIMSNAQEHLEKAIQINPEFADAHYELALILKDKNDYEECFSE